MNRDHRGCSCMNKISSFWFSYRSRRYSLVIFFGKKIQYTIVMKEMPALVNNWGC